MESNLAVLLQRQLIKWTIWMAFIHKKSEYALVQLEISVMVGRATYTEVAMAPYICLLVMIIS